MKEKEIYRERIIQMVREIKDADILQKIYTVVLTHMKIIKEKEDD